jgi:uncharacterized protein (DUF2141 family)
MGIITLAVIFSSCGGSKNQSSSSANNPVKTAQVTLKLKLSTLTPQSLLNTLSTNITMIQSIQVTVAASDITPTISQTLNITSMSQNITMSITVPYGTQRTFTVNAYDNTNATGTLIYSGNVTTDINQPAYSLPITMSMVSAGINPPWVAFQPISNLTTNSATLSALINPRGDTTTAYFEYGPTNSYGFSTTANVLTGTYNQSITATISGLTPGTPYHWHVIAYNGGGTSQSSDQIFYTQGAPGQNIYSISGTVGYTGSTTGWVYINVENAGGGSTMYGTSISGAGTFTIHGVPSGTYVLSAWLDNVGTGTRHDSNPTGTSTSFTVTSSDVLGISFSLSDPGTITLTQSPNLIAYAFSGTAIVVWNGIQDSNGIEIPDSYNVYWSTSNTPCSTAGGGVTSVVANTMGVFLQSGLTNGTTYYYSIQGVVGGNPGPCSSAYPVTPTTNSGSYTVSGTITNSVPPTGPLYVAIASGGNHGAPVFYGLESITSPSNTQPYSIAGIPNGTYSIIVIEDMNNDGSIDIGDITSGIKGNGATITVNGGNVTQDISLNGVNASARVTTQHYTSTTYSGYNLNSEISGEIKLPVGVELTAGPNVAVPVDIGNTGTNGGNGYFQSWFNLSNRPNVGDTYTFSTTYADATTENLTASVTGVLDSFATATFPTATDDGDGVTIPTFTWNAPSSPPSPYTYELWIQPAYSGNYIWDINLPSSQASALYNFDGSASQSSLTLGTTYNWTISVVDSYGNSAQYQTQWTP